MMKILLINSLPRAFIAISEMFISCHDGDVWKEQTPQHKDTLKKKKPPTHSTGIQ